jgi:hypothetical protein
MSAMQEHCLMTGTNLSGDQTEFRYKNWTHRFGLFRKINQEGKTVLCNHDPDLPRICNVVYGYKW